MLYLGDTIDGNCLAREKEEPEDPIERLVIAKKEHIRVLILHSITNNYLAEPVSDDVGLKGCNLTSNIQVSKRNEEREMTSIDPISQLLESLKIVKLFRPEASLAKEMFYKPVKRFEDLTGRNIFKEFFDAIQGTSKDLGITKNLAALLEDDYFIKSVPLPEHMVEIIDIAKQIFHNIGVAWAFMEQSRLEEDIEKESITTDDEILGEADMEIEPGITAVHVPKIETVTSGIRLKEDDKKRSLHLVTEGLFLDLASKWKWLEALPALHISSTGSHVIVYDKITKVILASALVQDISRKKNWLIKTPFFLQPIWGRKVNSPDFSQEQDDFTDALGIPRLKREWDSIDEFENAVTDKVGEDKVEESIRLTLNPNIKDKQMGFKIFFQTLAACFRLSHRRGKKQTFSVMAEHPALAIFRVLEVLSGKKIFISYAQNTIERSGHGKDSLHKIMVINQNAADAMEKIVTSESAPDSLRGIINMEIGSPTQKLHMWEIVYQRLYA